MNKIFRSTILLIVVSLYIVGNNQIAHSETVGPIRSQSSISFDKTYIPQKSNPVIPDGNQIFQKNQGVGILPRTGTTRSFYWEIMGISILIISLLLKQNNRRIKNEN